MCLILWELVTVLSWNVLISVDYSHETYNPSIINPIDWSGIDIKKESQGLNPKASDSIQFKIISDLLIDPKYSVVFNDDWSGEIADVVAINIDESNQRIELSLYHCKWSHEEIPWARVADLYEVCGQAQRSIRWHDIEKTIKRLLRRGWDNPVRFEKWDVGTLDKIRKALECFEHETHIYIVQPGLSKSRISDEQKRLLSVTEAYLKQVFQIPLKVLASE